MIGSTGLTRIPGLAINSSGDIYATSRSAEAVLYRIDAGTGSAVFVGIEDAEKLIPKECALEQNYPNPFNLSTTISYSIEHSGAVQFKIYNALGQLMRTLVNEEKYGGEYTVVWD